MHQMILVNPEKCTGCGVCELICSSTKEKVFNPRLSRIRVTRMEPFVDVALTCRFCEIPLCVSSCPMDALRQDEKSGTVGLWYNLQLYRIPPPNHCIGCGSCVEHCKFGAMRLKRKRHPVPISCDLCGGETPCVKFCPTGALELTTLEMIAQKHREVTAKEFLKSLAAEI
ncbi:MAG: 4Fe-4S dicluster domain-containing protein [Promethearchaeota archaeon]